MNDTPIYWVTPRLGVGPFASPARALALMLAGVTDILNVSDSRTFPETLAVGFRSVIWVPIADFVPISEEDTGAILTSLDAMFLTSDAVVFVHCLAGHNRSPTAIWLYLRSLGVNAEVAQRLIEQANPRAVGGHPMLISAETTQAVTAHRLARNSKTTDFLREIVLG